MPTHVYGAREALDFLIIRLRERDPVLHSEVLSAVNAGKDIEEADVRGRRRRPRTYRKTAPYTDEEALTAVLSVLEAHFLEQPLFVNSAADDFGAAVLGEPDNRRGIVGRVEKGPGLESESGVSHDKRLEVEIETETTQVPASPQSTLRMDRVLVSDIAEQRSNLRLLSELLTFS